MKIRPTFWIFVALLIIADESHFLLCSLPAIFVHEIGHFVAILISKCKIVGISLSGIGAEIEIDNASNPYYLDILIYISGPIFSIIFSILSSCLGWYTMSGISLVLGLFNLLPISMLDGGKVLNSIFKIFLDINLADKICFIVSIVLSFIILLFGIYVMIFTRYNFTLVLLGLYFTYSSCRNA